MPILYSTNALQRPHGDRIAGFLTAEDRLRLHLTIDWRQQATSMYSPRAMTTAREYRIYSIAIPTHIITFFHYHFHFPNTRS